MMRFIGLPPVRRRSSGDMDIDTQRLGPVGREEFSGPADAGDPDEPSPRIDEGPADAAPRGDARILETADRQPPAGPPEGSDPVAATPGPHRQSIGEEPRGEPTPSLTLGGGLLPPAHSPAPPGGITTVTGEGQWAERTGGPVGSDDQSTEGEFGDPPGAELGVLPREGEAREVHRAPRGTGPHHSPAHPCEGADDRLGQRRVDLADDLGGDGDTGEFLAELEFVPAAEDRVPGVGVPTGVARGAAEVAVD